MKTIVDIINEDFLLSRGRPSPLGATMYRKGVNFAVFSSHATAVTMVLFLPGRLKALVEFPLDPRFNKTGDVWHALVEGIPAGLCYGFRMDMDPNHEPHLHRFDPSNILADPAAKSLSGGQTWGKPDKIPRRPLIVDSDFDWEYEQPLNRPLHQSIIYELHVRGFTQHESSGVKHPGTFQGLIEKIPYLQELGVNAVELLPINEFDELHNDFKNPETGEKLLNFWGYSSLSFLSVKSSYASAKKPGSEVDEFKLMVREMHKAGIEVILDMVFNHTAEGNEQGPVFSFKGIDNAVYYILDPYSGSYHNYSGCGNTINCNHPVVRQMIIDCLRYWVTEMHIDGFRFDLASILGRGRKGEVLANPPLLESIAHDPILAGTKIIAEAWDAAGLNQVGSFPAWGRWAEWNGHFRDDIRRFVKGDPGLTPRVASRLLGSPDLYFGSGRRPFHSINFITCHDGFTLRDLVSYNHKHNYANGENGLDGSNQNYSWNCGSEGPTGDPAILALRKKQSLNLAVILMLSDGVPLILAGDEFGRTQNGNNNTWCQDNETGWVDWNLLEKNSDLSGFFRGLISFRKQSRLLKPENFNQIQTNWHGLFLGEPDWNPWSHTLAMHRHVHLNGGNESHLFFMMNMYWKDHEFELPWLNKGMQWRVLLNTGTQEALIHDPAAGPVLNPQGRFHLGGRSLAVILAGEV